jgi:hypothetical protein
MRVAIFVTVVACGGAAANVVVTEPPAANESPSEAPPDHVMEHHHIDPAHADDPSKLYVEITSDGDHESVLRQSATAALGTVPYAVSVAEGGDVELHVELASLAPANDAVACKVKIFVMRLPQHDLLAIADGAARATGAGQTDNCLSTIGKSIVANKVPAVLQRQLAAKR